MTRREEKDAVRLWAEKTETALSPAYCRAADSAIIRRLLALPDYTAARTVLLPLPSGRGIDLRPLWKDALQKGKRAAALLPAREGAPALRALALPQAPGFDGGVWEVPADAPAVSADEVEFAVIPCAACDRFGRRLGRGGGRYDRFLAVYRGSAVLACREEQLRAELPCEPLDRPVPWVVTERALYEDGVPARPE